MRLQTTIKVGAIIVLTGLLAACGSNNTAVHAPPANTNTLASQFGSEFATIFDASSTSQPATPDNNAVPPLTPAANPVANPATS